MRRRVNIGSYKNELPDGPTWGKLLWIVGKSSAIDIYINRLEVLLTS